MAWTRAVSSGGRQFTDPAPVATASALPVPRPERDAVLPYLRGAFDRGLLDPTTLHRLEDDLAGTPAAVPAPAAAPVVARAGGTATLPPPPIAIRPPAPVSYRPGPPARPAPPAPYPASPAPRPARPPAPPVPPVPTTPSAFGSWWERTSSTVSADLAVHGLAYLGVLLLFAGLFGFVAFAFGDIERNLRPLAELAIATAFFGAAWFLRRRRAPFVADALEFLGGAVLPVVAIASLTDGAVVPPDLEGAALVGAVAITNVVLAGAYAAVSLRRPTSPLRFLAAPALWLAVAATGLLFAQTIPSGTDISRPIAAQWALVAVAIAVTVALARLRPTLPLAQATMIAAVPGLLLAEFLTLSAASTHGWPAGPALVSGLALVLCAELCADRLPRAAITPAQTLVLLVTALAVAPAWGTGWAAGGLTVAAVALAERSSRVRSETTNVVLPLGLATLAVLLTPLDATAAWTVGGAAWCWAVARRVVPLVPLPRAATAPAIWVLPFIALEGVALSLPGDTTLLVSAAVVAAVAAAVLATRTADGLWGRWVPVYGGLLAFAALLVGTVEAYLPAAAVSAAAATVVLATAPRWPALRVWSSAAAALVAWSLAARALDLTLTQTGFALLGVGLVLVIVAALGRWPVLGHLGLVGHGFTLIGTAFVLVEAQPERWAEPLAFATVAAAFVVTTLAQETTGSTVAAVLDRLATELGPTVPPGMTVAPGAPPDLLRRLAACVPATLAILFVPYTVQLVVAEIGTWTTDSAWRLVPGAAVLAVGGLASRFVVDRHARLAGLLSHIGFWLLLGVALLTSLLPPPHHAALLACLGLLMAHVVAVAPATRRNEMTWIGWLATFPAAALIADLAGLEANQQYLVLSGWSIALVIGALALDDLLAGRRAAGAFVRRPELLPPVVLGAIGFPLAFVQIYTRPQDVFGWASLAAAALLAIVALQLRACFVTTLSWVLLFVAYAALVPWTPMEAPLTQVAFAAALLGVAAAFRSDWLRARARAALGVDLPAFAPLDASAGTSGPLEAPALELGGQVWWQRAEFPPFLTAHVVAVAAVVTALNLESVGRASWLAPTLATTGVLSIGITAAFVGWLARREPAYWLWGWAGIVLIMAAAVVAGSGWLALALAVDAVALTVWSVRLPEGTDDLARLLGVASAAGSWWAFSDWQAWTLEQGAVRTALASGALALGLGALVRMTYEPRRWVAEWAALPALGLVTTAGFLGAPHLDTDLVLHALAGALLAAAVGTAIAAAPTQVPVLREASAVLTLLAAYALAAARGLDHDAPTLVALFLAISVAATVEVVVIDAVRVGTVWVRPGLVLAGLATASALVPAVGELPRGDLLVAVLLVAGLEAAVAGFAGRRTALQDAAPLLLCAAWLTYAAEASGGDPQWFAPPIGLALLAVVAINRWRLREAGQGPVTPTLTAIDLLAMAFIVSPALIETVTTSVAYGLMAIVLGLVLVGFGVLTRVRRRLAVGAATVVVAVGLMVLTPLAELLPRGGGPALYLSVAAIGLVAILLAAFLEQGRATTRRAIAKLRQLTDGWE